MRKAEAQHQRKPDLSVERQGKKGMAIESPHGDRIAQLRALVENSPRMREQIMEASPRLIAQRRIAGMTHDEDAQDPLQPEVAQREEAPAMPNDTGLPDNLKNGIESLSGISMDGVKVHYNSAKPAQLNALAYAQGTDIHLAPGQERHLPHEAWHVAQQAQGRVRPTMQMKGRAVNDDPSLEKEADMMGEKAAQFKGAREARNLVSEEHVAGLDALQAKFETVQRVVGKKPEGDFESNLAWACWFAEMDEGERATHYEMMGIAPEAIAEMNGVLISNSLSPLSDALPEQSQDRALVITPSVGTDAASEEQDQAETSAESRPIVATPSAEEAAQARHLQRTQAVTLRISKDKKKFKLDLLNGCEEPNVIGSVTKAAGESATIAKAMGQPCSVGTYPLTTTGFIHSVFKYQLAENEKKSEAQLHMETLTLGDNSTLDHVPQRELFSHLQGAMKEAKGPGHAGIKIAKVPLNAIFLYKVYGKEHCVSHLYLQPGNETEIRCYLGTPEGAFQRIHTSLTVQEGSQPTAHTMVQTGPRLGIPGIGGKGERVGFDSVELGEGLGLANRKLTGRSKKQCTVDGYLEGRTLAEIGIEAADVAEKMAVAFNTTLDQVAKDIAAGKFLSGNITRAPDFLPLDESKEQKDNC